MRAAKPWPLLLLLLCGCARACGLEGEYVLGVGGAGGEGGEASEGGEGGGGGATPRSPFAHYLLDEDEGLVAHDVVGYLDGALKGATIWKPTGGKIGGALEVNGVTGHVSLGVRDAFDFGADDFSITVWVRYPSLEMDNEDSWVIVQHGNVNDAYYRIYLSYSLANGRRVYFQIGNTTRDPYTPGVCKFFLDDKHDQWFLFAAVRTEADLSLYVNGLLWSRAEIVPVDVSAAHETTFGMSPGNLLPFPGRLDDVRFYDVALTEEEVALLYQEVEAPWQRPECLGPE